MINRFEKELSLYNNGYKIVVEVDEVGRGPLAGPVVAGAVMFPKLILEKWWDEITDSKKLSEKKREYLYEHIINSSLYSIAEVGVDEIEKLNILQASLMAMKRSAENLKHRYLNFNNNDFNIVKSKTILLIDGKQIITKLNDHQEAIVRGDSVVHSIAAASIIAKVYRDRLMKQIHNKFPVYGFDKHKGYGTKFHIEAIKKYGLSPIHRTSFCGNIL